MKKSTVTRTDLLTVHLHDKQSLSKVEIKKIVIPQKGKADYHLHSCPVVGYVVSGTLLFQIEGQSSYLIKAGEAFYEPKNQPILHFDNASDSTLLRRIRKPFYAPENENYSSESSAIFLYPQSTKY